MPLARTDQLNRWHEARSRRPQLSVSEKRGAVNRIHTIWKPVAFTQNQFLACCTRGSFFWKSSSCGPKSAGRDRNKLGPTHPPTGDDGLLGNRADPCQKPRIGVVIPGDAHVYHPGNIVNKTATNGGRWTRTVVSFITCICLVRKRIYKYLFWWYREILFSLLHNACCPPSGPSNGDRSLGLLPGERTLLEMCYATTNRPDNRTGQILYASSKIHLKHW